MFHTHDNHILQPFIDRAKKELSETGNAKKTLILLNSRLVKFNPRIVSCVDPYYSPEEEKEALKLLRENGFAATAKLSPRCRRQILLDLGQMWIKEKYS